MTTLIFEPATAIAPSAQPMVQERDYISFSAIRTYQDCPLRYFFRYVAGLPEETVAASLVFGGAIHRAVEHHFREILVGNSPPDLESLLAEYQKGWEERDTKPIRFGKDDDRASMDGLAEQMLRSFQAHDMARPPGRILAVEEQLRGAVIPGLPDVLGRVDLIVETDAELVISDWKTSRSRWSAEQAEDAAEQLLLYAELAHDFAPGKTIRLEFAVLTKTKEAGIHRHVWTADPLRIARTKQVVERVWQAIEAGHYYPAPSPLNCGGCPFRRPCRAWSG